MKHQRHFERSGDLVRAVRTKAVPVDASALQDNEQRSPIQPATRVQRIKALWPWAFLAFAGVITLAWAIGLGWAAFAFVRWLVGF
jgi:hypothetical protein